MQNSMTFLIDTNVLIAAEPYDGKLESQRAAINRFIQLANRHHKIVVHPATQDDLKRTRDPKHRQQNLAAYGKYNTIAEIKVDDAVRNQFPDNPDENDECDARILAALHAGAVSFLVTSDERLRKRAIALGHEPRVLRPVEAADQLESWHPAAPTPPPTVECLPAEQIDPAQRLFAGLRDDYPEFDEWLMKVKQDSINRPCWIVRSPDDDYEAIALVKPQDDHPIIPGGKAIKLSTFKVDERANGRRVGEMLLKTVLVWAHKEPNHPSELFVEVKDNKAHLIDFLQDFGFARMTQKSPGESIYIKRLTPDSTTDLSSLDYHRKYGPPAIKIDAPIYIVPIKPHFFLSLFPDMPSEDWHQEQPLFALPSPHGNAIRKAYLCNSRIKSIPPGATLLFYQSGGSRNTNAARNSERAVVAIGVAESSHRSNNPEETARLAFKRTVFSKIEVDQLHEKGEVLTILFRHDRFPESPWTLDELIQNEVLKSWPQSVSRITTPKGIAWVANKLVVSP